MEFQDVGDYGVRVLNFKDHEDEKCVIQESFTAYPATLRFGRWANRMILTQEQVKELLPLLQKFAENGII